MKTWLALTAVLLLSAAASVRAQADGDVDDVDDPDVAEVFENLDRTYSGGGKAADDGAPPGSFDPTAAGPYNTKLTYLFPEAPFLNIESGKYTEVLVGVTNTAEGTLIVRTVEASFRYPQDMTQVLQNFTVYKYDVVIEGGEQATVSYRIPIGPVFQPLDVGLVVLLTFEVPENKYFQMVAFNGTVNLVDPVRTFDLQALFLYIFSAAVVAGAGYFIYNTFFAKRLARGGRSSAASSSSASGSSGKASSKPETGTSKNDEVDMQWIPAQNLATSPSTKARKR